MTSNYVQRLFDNINPPNVNALSEVATAAFEPEMWMEEQNFVEIQPDMRPTRAPQEAPMIEPSIEEETGLPPPQVNIPEERVVFKPSEVRLQPEIENKRPDEGENEPEIIKPQVVRVPLHETPQDYMPPHETAKPPTRQGERKQTVRIEPSPIEPEVIEKVYEVEKDVEGPRIALEPHQKVEKNEESVIEPAISPQSKPLFEPNLLRPETEDDIEKTPRFQPIPETETESRSPQDDSSAPAEKPQIIREVTHEVVRIEAPPKPSPRSAAEASSIGPIRFGKARVFKSEGNI